MLNPVLLAQEGPIPVAPPSPIPLERVEVQEVEFQGNSVLSDEELQQAIPVKRGTTISPTLVTESIRQIENAYARDGYIAEVPGVTLVGEEPSRTLVFAVREVVVSEIIIEGLERTDESAIRSLIDLEEGDLFNTLVLQADVRRISGLAIFGEVIAELEAGDELGDVVVIYTVTEQKTRRVTLGGSYSPADRLVAEVIYTQSNLFGRAQRLSATLSVGTVEGNIDGQIAYYNPLVASPRTDLLVRAFRLTNYRFTEDLVLSPDFDTYSERRTGLQAVAGRSFGEFTRGALGLRFEDVDADNLPTQFFTDSQLGTGGSVYLATGRYTMDRRLYLVLPSAGRFYTIFSELGAAERRDGTGGILKLSGQHIWHRPLKRITPEMITREDTEPIPSLAIRLAGGLGLGGLPFYEQYFLGGAHDLRGYEEGRFWGRHYLLLNAEYRHPLTDRLFGVAFVDVGDAWGSDFQFVDMADTDFRQHQSLSLNTGAGVGILYVTQFGILRLDAANGDGTHWYFAFGESF